MSVTLDFSMIRLELCICGGKHHRDEMPFPSLDTRTGGIISTRLVTGNVDLDHVVNAVSVTFLHCKVLVVLYWLEGTAHTQKRD